jgi:hypothetical protein
MSRVMGYRFPGHRPGVFCLVAPVVAVGVDVVAAEDVVVVFADDGDGVAGHQDQYWAVMLADQVTARQIERVDHMERDGVRYPTTVEGSVRLIDSY